MQNNKFEEDDIQKFMQGCEDLVRLGTSFAENIRSALGNLKKTYDPALKSQYVDKAVVDLLTNSWSEFEKKVNANLDGIDKICTKGGKWFAYYLGRSVENAKQNEPKAMTIQPRVSLPSGAPVARKTKKQGN